MARRIRRRLVVVVVAALTVGLLPGAAPAPALATVGSGYRMTVPSSVPAAPVQADWTESSIHNASADYTYEGGNALGRTVTSAGTAYLHAIANGTRVGTTPVKDTGPYAPVSYSRGNATGTSWTAALRLNPTNQHGLWPGLATADASVYTSWVKVTKVVSFNPGAARSIQFRSNANHGSGSWTAVKTLTSASGRVDYPSIAAAGANVFIAYTDANTGAVRLLISHDRGGTWANASLGTTTATSSAGGRTGLPSVAASGKLVVLTWIADGNGAVKARISQDAGAHWFPARTLTTASVSYPVAAATTNRAAVGWIGLEPTYALWTQKGGWAGPYEVPGVNHVWLEEIYGPALVLTGWSTIGFGYSGCVQVCSTIGTDTHFESYYSESPNNGQDWYLDYSIPVASGPDGRRGADGLSVLASSSTKREFLFTWWQPGTATTRVVHRTLTITPTDAPTHVITPRRPTTAAVSPRPRETPPPPSALRTREPFRT